MEDGKEGSGPSLPADLPLPSESNTSKNWAKKRPTENEWLTTRLDIRRSPLMDDFNKESDLFGDVGGGGGGGGA